MVLTREILSNIHLSDFMSTVRHTKTQLLKFMNCSKNTKTKKDFLKNLHCSKFMKKNDDAAYLWMAIKRQKKNSRLVGGNSV